MKLSIRNMKRNKGKRTSSVNASREELPEDEREGVDVEMQKRLSFGIDLALNQFGSHVQASTHLSKEYGFRKYNI